MTCSKHYINKKKLSEIVFNYPKEKSSLERIIHPVVYESRDNFINKNPGFYFYILSKKSNLQKNLFDR